MRLGKVIQWNKIKLFSHKNPPQRLKCPQMNNKSLRSPWLRARIPAWGQQTARATPNRVTQTWTGPAGLAPAGPTLDRRFWHLQEDVKETQRKLWWHHQCATTPSKRWLPVSSSNLRLSTGSDLRYQMLLHYLHECYSRAKSLRPQRNIHPTTEWRRRTDAGWWRKQI